MYVEAKEMSIISSSGERANLMHQPYIRLIFYLESPYSSYVSYGRHGARDDGSCRLLECVPSTLGKLGTEECGARRIVGTTRVGPGRRSGPCSFHV